MNFIIKTILLLFLSITYLKAEVTFKSEEDEFTGEKMEYIADMGGISAEIEKSLETVTMKWVYFAYNGTTCFLSLNAYYDDWNEMGTDTAYVILDGEKWNNHQYVSDTDVGNGDVYESYGFLYQKIFCEKIVNSKNFRAKVGNLIFSIDLTKLPMSKFSL